MYDSTYLCVRDDSLMAQVPEYESLEVMINNLKNVKLAAQAYTESRFADAVNAWPDFPDGYIGMFEGNRANFHKMGFDAVKKELIDKAHINCPDCVEIYGMEADVNMRFSRWEQAIKCFEVMLKMRPTNSQAAKGLSHSWRQLGHHLLKNGDQKKGLECLVKSRNVMRYVRETSPADIAESVNWIYDDNARLPTPFEK